MGLQSQPRPGPHEVEVESPILDTYFMGESLTTLLASG